MVIESDTTTWSSGPKRWRLHAGSTVEDSCGTLYQHVVTGSSSIGVVSFGTTSSWGGALEDVPVVATTADIVPSTLTILKVTGTYQKCKKKQKTIYIVLILITLTVSQWRYFWWIGCISLWLGTCDLNYLWDPHVNIPQLDSSDPSEHWGVKSQSWEAGIHCPDLQAKLLLPQGLGVVAGGGLPEGKVIPDNTDKCI